MYTRALLIPNLGYKHGLDSVVEYQSLLDTLLAQVSCNHSTLPMGEWAAGCARCWPDPHTGRSRGTAPTLLTHSQGPSNHPPLAPCCCQEAPPEACEIALRCAHHGACHRSLLLLECKQGFHFLSHLPPQAEPSQPGPKIKVYSEASLSDRPCWGTTCQKAESQRRQRGRV